jgi:hypothetical protein
MPRATDINSEQKKLNTFMFEKHNMFIYDIELKHKIHKF